MMRARIEHTVARDAMLAINQATGTDAESADARISIIQKWSLVVVV